jgi:Myosin tail.
LKHTVETLHEEQERIVKIEAIKKSLEIEVKNLSIRLEEVEANAIVGGKRIISKLEARVSNPKCHRLQSERMAFVYRFPVAGKQFTFNKMSNLVGFSFILYKLFQPINETLLELLTKRDSGPK